MNPILNQMMSSMFANNPILGMFKAVMSAKNPNAVLQSLAQQNPQLQQTLDYINQNGGDAKTLYYKMAKEKGKDPNIIINQLTQFKS